MSSRRSFLKTGVWGGSCLAFGLRAARAEASTTGRPVLTEASFNQMMREAQTAGTMKRLAAEAGRDPKGWLQRNFTLTPVQAQQVQGLPPAVVQQISKALAPVAQKGGAVELFMTEAPASKVSTQAKQPGCRKFGLTARAVGGAEMTVAHTLPGVQVQTEQKTR
jgi:hypothetical protein